MNPTRDTAASAALEAAVGQIARDSEHATETPWTTFAVTSDRGHVPPRIPARLSGLAARYGYTMSRRDLNGKIPGGVLLGGTAGPLHPDPADRMTVQIERTLSPASAARVMCHENAHIILGHTGLTMQAAHAAMAKRDRAIRLWRDGILDSPEDAAEEAAAELAAGAFCKVAGIGTGLFSPMFINGKLDGQPVPADAIHAGKLAARILWAAASPALERRAA